MEKNKEEGKQKELDPEESQNMRRHTAKLPSMNMYCQNWP